MFFQNPWWSLTGVDECADSQLAERVALLFIHLTIIT